MVVRVDVGEVLPRYGVVRVVDRRRRPGGGLPRLPLCIEGEPREMYLLMIRMQQERAADAELALRLLRRAIEIDLLPRVRCLRVELVDVLPGKRDECGMRVRGDVRVGD